MRYVVQILLSIVTGAIFIVLIIGGIKLVDFFVSHNYQNNETPQQVQCNCRSENSIPDLVSHTYKLNCDEKMISYKNENGVLSILTRSRKYSEFPNTYRVLNFIDYEVVESLIIETECE